MGCTEDAILAGFVLCVITLAIRYTTPCFIFQPVLLWYHKSKAVSFLFIGSSMGLSYLVWSSIAAARSHENCKVPSLTFILCICDCVCNCISVLNGRHPPFVRHIHCDISHTIISNMWKKCVMWCIINVPCTNQCCFSFHTDQSTKCFFLSGNKRAHLPDWVQRQNYGQASKIRNNA